MRASIQITFPSEDWRIGKRLVEKIGTLHIGIMTNPERSSIRERAQKLWIDEFRKSPFYGGIHFISEEKVTDMDYPTSICNWTQFDRPGFPMSENINRRQGAKRILSFGAFLYESNASFHAATVDDVLVDVVNLRYLWEWILTHNYTANTPLVLGNCLWLRGGSKPSMLQGGSGYFMSRKSAGDFHASSNTWFERMPQGMEEDLWISHGLKYPKWTVYDASSEYFLGQYINPEQKYIMERKEYHNLPVCPTIEYITEKVPPRKCRIFLARFNRLVFFHRLTIRHFRNIPTHPHTYADDIRWYMMGEMPWFCRLNGTTV